MSFARQMTILATSSPEAECYAACSLAAELLYVQGLFRFLGIVLPLEMSLDASSAIALASRAGLGSTRHMDVK